MPPFSQYASMAWYSVKAQGQFYLYILPLKLHVCINLSTKSWRRIEKWR